VENLLNKMNFKKDKYLVKKNILSKEMCDFMYHYFFLRVKVADTLFKTTYISNSDTDWGTWADPQVPNTFSIYGDIATETLLMKLRPVMEKATNLKLVETYSYARVYKKGDVLKKHLDRKSCDISTTLNLGGDPWPIFLKDTNNKTIKVNLKPGDMLIYSGCELEHWREEFTGNKCIQTFLHFNKAKKKDSNQYDNRLHLGLPCWFKEKFNK
tara:strand:+ start:274 stop:909 length:636 start_codon:yes stop_codon:yes gene_type:complete